MRQICLTLSVIILYCTTIQFLRFLLHSYSYYPSKILIRFSNIYFQLLTDSVIDLNPFIHHNFCSQSNFKKKVIS